MILTKILQFLKKNWFTIAAIIIAIICLMTCNDGCGGERKIIKSDTTIVHDTVKIALHDTVHLPAKELKSISTIIYVPKLGEVPKNCDTLNKAYTSLLVDHKSTKIYSNTIALYDSTFKMYIGKVDIIDSVRENKVKQQISYIIDTLPVIHTTTTITNTIEASKKGQTYIGAEVGGNRDKYVGSLDLGILYKTKNSHIYKVGYELPADGTPGQVKIGAYIKL